MRADEILRAAAQTFEERNAGYKNNYLTAGSALAALFPDGITLKSPEDWQRMHILMLLVVKLSRYAIAWNDMHQDSIRDACVYSAMLEMIDGEILDKKVQEFKTEELRSAVARITAWEPRGPAERTPKQAIDQRPTDRSDLRNHQGRSTDVQRPCDCGEAEETVDVAGGGQASIGSAAWDV